MKNKPTANPFDLYLDIQSSFTEGSGQNHRLKRWLDNGTNTQKQKWRKTLMENKNLMPQVAQPVNRTTRGKLPAELAELTEEALQLDGDSANSAAVSASRVSACDWGMCSYDGDDAE